MAIPDLFAIPQFPYSGGIDQAADWLLAVACEDGHFNFATLNHYNIAILNIPPGFHDSFVRCVRRKLLARPDAATRVRQSLFGRLLFSDFESRNMAPPVAFPSPQFAYSYYASIAFINGSEQARATLRRGRLGMLSLRHSSSTLANKGRGSYDDTLVVLKGRGGTRKVALFPICTEPGAQYSARAAIAPKSKSPADERYKGIAFRKADGVDINKDGIKDAGRLVQGTYIYSEKAGGFLGARAFQVKAAQVAERDTDGDGLFTSADLSRIDLTGAGTSMYIHRGGEDTAETPNTWSAGCQTIPKNRYGDFLGHVPTGSTFPYVLVNAS